MDCTNGVSLNSSYYISRSIRKFFVSVLFIIGFMFIYCISNKVFASGLQFIVPLNSKVSVEVEDSNKFKNAYQTAYQRAYNTTASLPNDFFKLVATFENRDNTYSVIKIGSTEHIFNGGLTKQIEVPSNLIYYNSNNNLVFDMTILSLINGEYGLMFASAAIQVNTDKYEQSEINAGFDGGIPPSLSAPNVKNNYKSYPLVMCIDIEKSMSDTDNDLTLTDKSNGKYIVKAGKEYTLKQYAVGCIEDESEATCLNKVNDKYSTLKNLCQNNPKFETVEHYTQNGVIKEFKSLVPKDITSDTLEYYNYRNNIISISAKNSSGTFEDGVKIGFSDSNISSQTVRFENTGWITFLEHAPTLNINGKNSKVFSPIISVVPNHLKVSNSVLVDYFNVKKKFLVDIVSKYNVNYIFDRINNSNSDYLYNLGIEDEDIKESCPIYFNQPFYVMGYFTGANESDDFTYNFTNDFFSTTQINYVGIHPISSTVGGKYFLEKNPFVYNDVYQNGSNYNFIHMGFGEYTNGKGVSFYSLVNVEDRNRNKLPTDLYLAYYAEVNACIANNNTNKKECNYLVQTKQFDDPNPSLLPTTDSNDINYVVVDTTKTNNVRTDYSVKDNVNNFYDHLSVLDRTYLDDNNLLQTKVYTTFYNGRIKIHDTATRLFSNNVNTTVYVPIEIQRYVQSSNYSSGNKLEDNYSWQTINDYCTNLNIRSDHDFIYSDILVNGVIGIQNTPTDLNSYKLALNDGNGRNTQIEICSKKDNTDCANQKVFKGGLLYLGLTTKTNIVDNYKSNTTLSLGVDTNDNTIKKIYCTSTQDYPACKNSSDPYYKSYHLEHLFDEASSIGNVLYRVNMGNKRILRIEEY